LSVRAATRLQDRRHVHRSIGLGRCASGESDIRGEGRRAEERGARKAAQGNEDHVKLLGKTESELA